MALSMGNWAYNYITPINGNMGPYFQLVGALYKSCIIWTELLGFGTRFWNHQLLPWNDIDQYQPNCVRVGKAMGGKQQRWHFKNCIFVTHDLRELPLGKYDEKTTSCWKIIFINPSHTSNSYGKSCLHYVVVTSEISSSKKTWCNLDAAAGLDLPVRQSLVNYEAFPARSSSSWKQFAPSNCPLNSSVSYLETKKNLLYSMR